MDTIDVSGQDKRPHSLGSCLPKKTCAVSQTVIQATDFRRTTHEEDFGIGARSTRRLDRGAGWSAQHAHRPGKVRRLEAALRRHDPEQLCAAGQSTMED